MTKRKAVIGFDTETYSNPGLTFYATDARIRMVQLTDKVGRAWVVQLTQDSGMPDWLVKLAEDPSILKVGSNIRYDIKWMSRFGVRMKSFEDTSTLEHLIDPTNPKKNLKALTLKYLPRLGDYARGHLALVKERGGWENVRDDEQYEYAAADAEASIATWQGQQAALEPYDRPRRLLKATYAALAEMEFNGACIYLAENRRLDAEYRARMKGLRAAIRAVLGPINVDSHVQLRDALRSAVPGIDLTLREWRDALDGDEAPEFSTKKEILEREIAKHPVVRTVLDYRKLDARWKTFIKGIHDKHIVEHHGGAFVHASYRTDVAETYRLSATQPPMHGIPKDREGDEPELSLKRQFVSRWDKGSILAVDLTQAEFRFAAWASQDPGMLAAIERGADIHRDMAAMGQAKELDAVTDDERYIYKTITFLTMYGGKARRLQNTLLKEGIHVSIEQARALLAQYFRTFPRLRDYINEVGAQALRELEVWTHFGFRRPFAEPATRPEKWGVQREAFNTIVQNGAAALAHCALIWLQNAIEERNLQSKIIIYRHDELVLDVYPGEEEEVSKLTVYGMEIASVELARSQYGVDFTVPLKADAKIGPNWGELKPLEEL